MKKIISLVLVAVVALSGCSFLYDSSASKLLDEITLEEGVTTYTETVTNSGYDYTQTIVYDADNKTVSGTYDDGTTTVSFEANETDYTNVTYTDYDGTFTNEEVESFYPYSSLEADYIIFSFTGANSYLTDALNMAAESFASDIEHTTTETDNGYESTGEIEGGGSFTSTITEDGNYSEVQNLTDGTFNYTITHE